MLTEVGITSLKSYIRPSDHPMYTPRSQHGIESGWNRESVPCLCVLELVYKTLTSLSSWAVYYNELRWRKGRASNKHRHVREPCNHVKLYNTKGYPKWKPSFTHSPDFFAPRILFFWDQKKRTPFGPRKDMKFLLTRKLFFTNTHDKSKVHPRTDHLRP